MAEGSRKRQRKAKVGCPQRGENGYFKHKIWADPMFKQTNKGLFRTQALLKMKDLRADELQNGQKLEDKVEQFLKQHKETEI